MSRSLARRVPPYETSERTRDRVSDVPEVPLPVAAWRAGQVARLLYQTHRRPPSLPWHPVATATIGFWSTVAGAAYATPDLDAVALVWRGTPGGVARGASRVLAVLAAPPAILAAATRSWRAPGAMLVAEIAAIGAIDAVFEISSRRARSRWLAKPANDKPSPSDKISLFRWGHLVGLGVGATTPHAADRLCRSIAHHADLPIYLVATTPAHRRLYRRFGFEPAGPSWYGETPMLRPPGPAFA